MTPFLHEREWETHDERGNDDEVDRELGRNAEFHRSQCSSLCFTPSLRSCVSARVNLVEGDISEEVNAIEDFNILQRSKLIVTGITNACGVILIYDFSPTTPGPISLLPILELPFILPDYRVFTVGVHSGPLQRHPTPRTPFTLRSDTHIQTFTLSYIKDMSSVLLRYCEHDPSEAPSDVQWSTWGEHGSLLIGPRPSFQWLRYAHGPRVVLKSDDGNAIEVLDFSDANLQRAASSRQHDPTVVPAGDVVLNEIVTRLPHRRMVREVEKDFFAYMIDEERIVGLYPDSIEAAAFSDPYPTEARYAHAAKLCLKYLCEDGYQQITDPPKKGNEAPFKEMQEIASENSTFFLDDACKSDELISYIRRAEFHLKYSTLLDRRVEWALDVAEAIQRYIAAIWGFPSIQASIGESVMLFRSSPMSLALLFTNGKRRLSNDIGPYAKLFERLGLSRLFVFLNYNNEWKHGRKAFKHLFDSDADVASRRMHEEAAARRLLLRLLKTDDHESDLDLASGDCILSMTYGIPPTRQPYFVTLANEAIAVFLELFHVSHLPVMVLTGILPRWLPGANNLNRKLRRRLG
ncbi:hypothetical protein NLJ89_g5860 [Agrocybe chaxingu]|uniref:Uncharacterized protein n=1 Tax=Agrocybe chaxingu TaxID=84603 RepID=A0A9W8MV76_9AGAR|nr:hypothetical protein NLJ89_g5860 [Agrocybe chaxingu]